MPTSESAIVVLLPSSARVVDELGVMAASLRRLQDGRATPVLLFHDQGIQPALLRLLRRVVEGNSTRTVRTAAVDFGNFSAPYPSRWWTDAKKHGVGYRQMCHFFSFAIFDHPALAHVTYLLRLDTDSKLKGEWPNLFASLDARPHVAYVANPLRHAYPDCGRVVLGLDWLTLKFSSEHHVGPLRETVSVRPQTLTERRNAGRTKLCVRAYFTNFEIIRLAAFRRSPRFARWRETVERDGGIFRHRWGDAPIRRISLNLMNERVASLWDLAPRAGYCHGRLHLVENGTRWAGVECLPECDSSPSARQQCHPSGPRWRTPPYWLPRPWTQHRMPKWKRPVSPLLRRRMPPPPPPPVAPATVWWRRPWLWAVSATAIALWCYTLPLGYLSLCARAAS